MSGRAALVVEGGAMRGVFSVGVLDVFLEESFDPFDLAIGVSAGACTLASHLAGQAGRNRRSFFEYMTRREFIDVRRTLVGRSAVDLDWLWAALAEREPLDVAAIDRRDTEFVVVATSASSGAPVYLRPSPEDIFDVLKGSCALPVLYQGHVHVGGERLVDGGVSDPIPVEEAYRRGARRILAIRTRPEEYVKKDGLTARANAWLMRGEPVVSRAVRGTAAAYQRGVAFLRRPPSDCQTIHLAPPAPLASSRTTRARAKLQQDYQLGRELGRRAIAAWAALDEGPMPPGPQ